MVLEKAEPLFISFFETNVAKIISYVSLQRFFVRFVDLHFVQCFSVTVLVVWFLKSLVKKKRTKKGKLQF